MAAHFKSANDNDVWFGAMPDGVPMEIDISVDGHPPLRIAIDNCGDAGYSRASESNAFMHLVGIPAVPDGDTEGQFISGLVRLESVPAWVGQGPVEALVRIVMPIEELRAINYAWRNVAHEDVEVHVPALYVKHLGSNPALAAVYYPGTEPPPDEYLFYFWVPNP